MASTKYGTFTNKVQLPHNWHRCTRCGLHYVFDERESSVYCTWYLDQLDDA
jgi:hypothetical protein